MIYKYIYVYIYIYIIINIYSALLQRIEHCSTRKSTCRLPIYIYIYIYINVCINLPNYCQDRKNKSYCRNKVDDILHY